MKPITHEVKRIIEQSAETCRDASKKVMKIQLEFDEASIERLDDIISEAWPNGPSGDQATDEDRYQMWGCFLGQAMAKVLNGQWVLDEGGYGVRIGDFVAHTITKVQKRFENGPRDSISFFYRTFRDGLPKKR